MPSARRHRSLVDSVHAITRHSAFWFSLTTLLTIAAAVAAWKHCGSRIVRSADFRFTEDHIQIPPQPHWSDQDLTKSLVDALDGSSMLSPQLVSTAVSTLEAVPWIDEVVHVEKSKSRLDIKLRYRQPVATVDVARGQRLPVDREGVVMDPRCLKAEPADALLVISVFRPNQTQLRPWSAWPDKRIVEASAICAVTAEYADTFQLYRIVSFQPPGRLGENRVPYELWTKSATKIVWGSAPGNEQPGEAGAAKKLQAIGSFIQQHGPLNEFNRHQKIDVRTGQPVLIKDVRTAAFSRVFDFPK